MLAISDLGVQVAILRAALVSSEQAPPYVAALASHLYTARIEQERDSERARADFSLVVSLCDVAGDALAEYRELHPELPCQDVSVSQARAWLSSRTLLDLRLPVLEG